MWFAQLVLMFGGSWLQSSALAQYQDGEVLVANFQSYIKRSFPTGVTFPNDDRWETWAETLIAKTAIDSLLRNHEETLQCVNQQDEKATNLWTVARQLAADVEQSYADELVISPLALKRSRQKLGDRDNHALVLFRSIFLKTTGKDTESIERAHLRMAAIRNQLKTRSFASLAQEYSDGMTAAKGGLVFWVPLNKLEANVANTLKKLAIGSISQPLQTRSGLHLFKLENRTILTKAQFEARAHEMARQIELDQRMNQLVDRLASTTSFQIKKNGWVLDSMSFSPEEIQTFLTLTGIQDDASAAKRVRQVLLLAWSTFRFNDSQDELWIKANAERLERCRQRTLSDLATAELVNVSERTLEDWFHRHQKRFDQSQQKQISLWFFKPGSDALNTQNKLRALNHVIASDDFFPAKHGLKLIEHLDRRWIDQNEIDRLHPQIQAALIEMKIDQVSNPIYCNASQNFFQTNHKQQEGFAVVKLHAETPASKSTFGDVSKLVRMDYFQNHRLSLAQLAMEKMLKAHQFKILNLPSRTCLESIINDAFL